MDGDLWFSIKPNEHCEHPHHYTGCYGASVRIRMPVTGGGHHDHLWNGVAQALRKEDEDLDGPEGLRD